MCLLDRVEEADVQTQTDAFLDRPSTPLFVPAKTGMDAATQIEEGDVSNNSSLFVLTTSFYVMHIFTTFVTFHSLSAV